MKAEIITIGTELLLGQIVDTNSQWIAERLAEMGIDLYYKTTVGDNVGRLKEVLEQSVERADLVITTGGLGPTQDDITREVVAEALNRDLIKNEAALEEIKSYFSETGRQMTENNITQSFLPKGSQIISNDNGTAPGFLIDSEEIILASVPGVPLEMKAMISDFIIPYLQEEHKLDKEVIQSRVIKTCGIGESSLEDKIDDILREQTNPTIAPLASQGEVKIRLTAKANSEEQAQQLIAAKEEELKKRIGDYIYGYDDDTLEGVVANLLWEQELTVATAESCTGGLIGDRLTKVPGSSRYFERGVISYSNQAKMDLLGVTAETLEEYGAVSAETAQEMACGIRDRAGVDIGLATTGIAGPGGGTEEKPVGLVYLALATDDGVEVHKKIFKGHRRRVKYLTSQIILNLLRKSLF
ncbi:competence/damage-inducible protein A [Halanaerobacter jeridensis]|uniref:Putative competence-damage inducible protein n=1 Tax=Halanaerobacter jeridensis TaxID=706427 RepID=A0A938XTI6_9FIRM|nr:competence/damage-inducible protein A [Halanaerobacter jeridensis]MBM7556031.1 nicotinamide-nucleotide amidase [Halanaerobacter jeridensis]